jgi:hypothetical protein
MGKLFSPDSEQDGVGSIQTGLQASTSSHDSIVGRRSAAGVTVQVGQQAVRGLGGVMWWGEVVARWWCLQQCCE